MARFCTCLPILLGAVAFPLSASALNVVELDNPSSAQTLLFDAGQERSLAPVPPMTVAVGASMSLATTDASGAPVFLGAPIPPRGAFPETEVSRLLERVELEASSSAHPARGWGAQLVAALVMVALVARRRLGGH